MKCVNFSVGALCAVVMLLSITCSKPEFDNPLDQRGDNYLYGDTSDEECKTASQGGGSSGLFDNRCLKYTLITNASPTSGGAISRSPNQTDYYADARVTLTATPAQGYVFAEWTNAPTSVNASSPAIAFNISGNMTLTANFAREGYTLATGASPATGGNVIRTPDLERYDSETQVNITAVPAEGYVFTGWTGAPESADPLNPAIIVSMTANISLTANFDPIAEVPTYTLTVNANPAVGGTVSPEGASTLRSGSSATIRAEAAQGYEFTGWTGQVPASVNASIAAITFEMNDNVALIANFRQINTGPTPITYTLSTYIAPAGGGSVSRSPNRENYEAGTQITLTATANDGFEFVSWTGNNMAVPTHEIVFDLNSNTTLTANFRRLYTLTTGVSPTGISGNITRSPNQDRYAEGTQVQVCAAATATGYTFSEWIGASSSQNSCVTITMDGNKTLTANYIQATYSLSVNSGSGGSAFYAPVRTNYSAGTQINVTATPDHGYEFTGWTGAPSSVNASSPSISFNITNNTILTANFSREAPTLTVNANPSVGGSVSPIGTTTRNFNSQVTVTATPVSGYEFAGWTGAPSTVNASSRSITFNITENMTLIANFQPAAQTTATLTVNATPVVGGTVSRSPSQQIYNIGTPVTVTATANPGYEFVSWDGDLTSFERTFSFNINSNMTLTANFKRVYTLTTAASPTAGGSVSRSLNQDMYDAGTQVTVTAIPNSGYRFTRWTGGSTSTNAEIIVPMNSNVTLTANFEPIPQYTLTASASPSAGGSVSRTPNQTSYADGSSVSVTASPASGYRFTGWSGASTSTSQTVSINMNGNKTLTANFELITYTLTIGEPITTGGGTGGSVSPAPGTTTRNTGTSVTVTATAASGYRFTGWSDGVTSASRTVTMNNDVTLTANFVRQWTLTVNRNLTAGGTVSGAGTYDHGASVSVTATAASGYMFTGWSDGVTSASRTVTMSSNVTLTANFEVIPPTTYTLTATASPAVGGSVTRSPNQTNYNAGTSVTVTATAVSGYMFTGWSDNVTSASRTVTMNNNVTLTAYFEIIPTYTFTATASPTAGGSITRTPSQTSYNAGTSVTLTATAASGYRFTGWSDDVTTATRTVTVSRNETMTAYFIQQWTLTLNRNLTAGGTVSGAGTYDNGASVSVTATAASGYRFTGWSDGVINASRTVTMSGNITLTAHFELITYTLTATASPTVGGSVTRTPNQTNYNEGTSVTVTATAASGYRFTGWSDGVTSAARTVTMSGNITLTAHFELITYTLTATASPTAGGWVTRSPNQTNYNAGASVSVTATAAFGYRFTGWSDGVTSASRTVTMSSNITLTANFELITYTLTVTASPTAGGSVTRTPNQTSYNAGASVTVTVMPNSGYAFDGWTGAPSSVNAWNYSIQFYIESDVTLIANFQQLFNPNISYGSFTDTRDGKSYRTVIMPDAKTWFAENLNYQTASGSWCYDDNQSICGTYGRLYTWSAAMNGSSGSNTNPSGIQGVCPIGWHLPSAAEWDALADAVGGWEVAGSKLKSQTYWSDPWGVSLSGTDEYGFSALSGGHRNSNGRFYDSLINGRWWSATDHSDAHAADRLMSSQGDHVSNVGGSIKTNAYSVRCVRD